MRPFGGPDRPIVVYALELPAGFPEVKQRGQGGRGAKLDEDVAFTGFFFKRWAYQATDGINTAPLILAKSPSWRRRDANRVAEDEAIDVHMVLLSVFATALLAVGIAATVYLQSRRSPLSKTARRLADDRDADALESIADVDVSPGVAESLRRLSDSRSVPADDSSGADHGQESS
jgi:hypothetical protein